MEKELSTIEKLTQRIDTPINLAFKWNELPKENMVYVIPALATLYGINPTNMIFFIRQLDRLKPTVVLGMHINGHLYCSIHEKDRERIDTVMVIHNFK